MRLASICSGIGGAELAFDGIATHTFASETDPFARAVLAHHFPHLTVHGDFTEITGDGGTVDVLVGGTPCQSFSVAGLRGGMADARGNLALAYLRLADRLRARWLVWENVPGVLSSGGGRDFGAFLGGLAELGYGFAYRVLDAQHFGLAQRRKRVFVVGNLGDWRRAAAVLFEPASLRGDPAPRRQARERTAPTLASRATAGGGLGTDFDCDGGLITSRALRPSRLGSGGAERDGGDTLIAFDCKAGANTGFSIGEVPGTLRGEGNGGGHAAVAYGGNRQSGPLDVATAVNAHGGPHGRLDFESETFIAHSLRADGFDASEDGTGRGTPLVAFQSRRHNGVVAFAQNSRSEVREMGGNVTGAVSADPGAQQQTYLSTPSAVRRLTPRECERLQGFPDDWTAIRYRGKPAADGNRYRALGNAFAVPVVRWIARRIAREDQT